jgi:hypothetical protein
MRRHRSNSIYTGCLQNNENAGLIIVSSSSELIFQLGSYHFWDSRGASGNFVPQRGYYYILRFDLEKEVVLRKFIHVLK